MSTTQVTEYFQSQYSGYLYWSTPKIQRALECFFSLKSVKNDQNVAKILPMSKFQVLS